MRLAVLSSDEMTTEQVDLYREILGGPRGQGPRAVLLASGAGGLAGPFNAMLYAPPVGHALQELGAAIRFRTGLAPRIREMAILVVAQAWDSAYERASHEPIGREAGLTDEILRRQSQGAFRKIDNKFSSQITIAYEPVWAIGTGKTATPEIAAAAHRIIRAELETIFGAQIATQIRILYGGSVKPENARSLMSQEEIDGALVGGASLDPRSFAAICRW